MNLEQAHAIWSLGQQLYNTGGMSQRPTEQQMLQEAGRVIRSAEWPRPQDVNRYQQTHEENR